MPLVQPFDGWLRVCPPCWLSRSGPSVALVLPGQASVAWMGRHRVALPRYGGAGSAAATTETAVHARISPTDCRDPAGDTPGHL